VNTQAQANQALVVLSSLAAALVCAMLALYVATGVGQDALQFVHPPAAYAALLLQAPDALRALLGLDNLFLTTYAAVFVLLARQLHARGAPALPLAVGTAAMLATAVLDLLENMNFLALLAAAELGHVPDVLAVHWQVVESGVKFHLSYLGLVLLGLAFPRTRTSERVLAGLLLFVQAPVGIAIHVAPPAFVAPLVFLRFAFFLAAFVLLAFMHAGAHRAAHARAEGGSGVPA
jgi:hypothetical protein